MISMKAGSLRWQCSLLHEGLGPVAALRRWTTPEGGGGGLSDQDIVYIVVHGNRASCLFLLHFKVPTHSVFAKVSWLEWPFGRSCRIFCPVLSAEIENSFTTPRRDRLCGLVVRVLGYRSGGPGSIPGITIFSEENKKRKTSSGSGTGSTQPREYNWGATW
jgi:hypothetical protein